MPKFSDNERETIHKLLLVEGERLFSAYGLKKVTIDDLAKAVTISKGSFYAFYQSKEELYVKINFDLQVRVFNQIENDLTTNAFLPPRVLSTLAINLVIQGFIANPILTHFDSDTWMYLRRKLPKEIFEQHIYDDGMVLKKLEKFGVEFLVPYSIATKVVHSVFACLAEFREEEDSKTILAILIKGVIDQIVKE